MAVGTLEMQDAVVFLAAAGLVVPVVHRLKVSPVLGFLLVGVVIGPFGLGRLVEAVPWLGHIVIQDRDAIAYAAELGVMFLLFMIGLELSLDRLWRMRGQVFGLGGAQVLVTAFAIGAIAAAFGNSLAVAIVLGSCLALSSTAIVMQLLTESGRLGTPVGRAGFAILLFQDLAVVPILFIVGALAGGSGSVLGGLAIALAKAAVAIAVLLALGRLVVRPVLRLVAQTGSRELFLAAVLLAVLGTAKLTEVAGLSLALGAFLAGLVLAETEYRHRIAVDVEPFKGLLLGVFFVSVGLGLDLALVLDEPFWIPASAVGLVALKALIIFALARATGQPRAVAAETAVLLGQGGEFAFVVIALATALALLPAQVAQFMLVVVTLTMLATPGLAALGQRLGRWLTDDSAHAGPVAAVPADLEGHVVIVGYGRVGRVIGSLLDGQKMAYVAIDRRPDRVAQCRSDGIAIHYGDASHHEMLARLGADRAAALVITMDNPHAVSAVAAAARKDWPGLPIYARGRDEAHARELIALGAAHVTPETLEASFQLGEAVLGGLGVPPDAARGLVSEQRDAARDRLMAAS